MQLQVRLSINVILKINHLRRLAGWWGTNKENRFKMEKEFDPIPTAEGWQLSNSPILNMAAHKASLDIFEEAGFENIVEKGKKIKRFPVICFG